MKRLHALALFSLASLTGCGNDDLVLSLSDISLPVSSVWRSSQASMGAISECLHQRP